MSSLSYEETKSTIIRTTVILSIITIAEVLAAIYLKEALGLWTIRVLMIVMSLAKSVYIVGVFMHLKYEINGFGYSVLLPLTFLFWGIAAFMWEGAWYLQADKSGLVDWLTGW